MGNWLRGAWQTPIGSRVAFFFFAAMLGVLVALATVALLEFISLVQWIGFGAASEIHFAEIAAAAPQWRVILTPLVGGLIVGITIYWLPGRRYHGIADVMEACAFNSGRMGVRSGLGAAFAAGVSIGSGAPLGREGPAVHIGASISAWFAEHFKLNRSQSLALLGCGAAAAVTTSFNAPVAGVLFALEVIVGYYTLRVFAPIVIASMLAVVVRHQFYGSEPIYVIPGYTLSSLWELPLFALLGVLGALLVTLFIFSVTFTEKAWKFSRVSAWLRPAAAGLIIGLIAVRYPMILSVGYEPVLNSLRETLPHAEMIALLLLKTLATALAIGSGFAGGVFGPSVFLGAMLGGVYCFTLGLVGFDGLSTQAVYSIVGMAGVASAMLGAPISTVIIVFEVTRSYEVTVAVMIAAAFASTVMQFGKHRSWFRWQLAKRGVKLSAGRDASLLMSHTVEKLVTQRATLVEITHEIHEVETSLGSERQRVAIALDQEQQFAGCLDLRAVVVQSIEKGRDAPVTECMLAPEIAISADTNVVAALQKMADFEIDYLPVVRNNATDEAVAESNYLGVIFRSDLLAEHYQVLRKAREDEFGVA